MKIENLKDLKKVMQLCQENGVSAFEADGVKLNLNLKANSPKPLDFSADIPESQVKIQVGIPDEKINVKDLASNIAMEELTEEQRLFYSTGIEPGLEQQ